LPWGSVRVFEGFQAHRLEALLLLSSVFLALVILTGLLKFYINTFKGRLGERMLQQLRYELFDRVLRFPLGEFRRAKAAEISTMIKDEVEPMGGFIGDAFVQPVFLAGQIVTALGFILVQSLSLGTIAVALLLVQGVVIPRLRRKQIELGRQRQLTARALAGRIAEVVEDMPSIRTNGSADFLRADIAQRLTKIFAIRFALYQWKFFVKFLNNMLAQMTPFLFYVIGGYFAIKGSLDIGQLVAVIAAYKDLPTPVKELIDWDQQRMDVDVKYRQVIEQFDREGLALLPPPVPAEPGEVVPRIEGEIALYNITVEDYAGARLLDQLTLRLRAGEVARLGEAKSGSFLIGGRDVRDWPGEHLTRRISYAGPETYFAAGSILSALLGGARRRAGALDGSRPPLRTSLHRVIDTGGIRLDDDDDWIDYDILGIDGPAALRARIGEVLALTSFDGDIFSLGFNATLPASASDDDRAGLIAARASFRTALEAAEMLHLVEEFDPASYAVQASIAENLLFGTPVDPAYSLPHLAANPALRRVLAAGGLDTTLFDLGLAAAGIILEIFEGLSPDSPMFQRLTLMQPERFAETKAATNRVEARGFAVASEADRTLFLDLAFNYVEPRDRLGLLTEDLHARILAARQDFHAKPGKPGMFVPYDRAAISMAATIQDNILFGRIAYGVAAADSRINVILRRVVEAGGLTSLVHEAGLAFNVGNAGKRLNPGQKQKLALARALLRRPDLLIAQRCLSNLDTQSQIQIMERIIEAARQPNGFGVVWTLSNPTLADLFDRAVVIDDGHVVEDGPPAPLRATGGALARLSA
jgi:putative ABC transport system ATP-binding protein